MTRKEYAKQYREANKEKIKARQKEWHKKPENKAKHAEQQRKWRVNSREKYRAIAERAYAKHQAKPTIQWEIILKNRMKQYVIAKTENEAINRLRLYGCGDEVLSIKQYCIMPTYNSKWRTTEKLDLTANG